MLSQDVQMPDRVFICKAIEFILKHNYFTFNNIFYLQTQGTAMGTKFAPSYANLFMGMFEDKIGFLSHPNIKFYRRFIEDIIFIWKGDSAKLCKFIEELNSNDWNLTFTLEFSATSVIFLDLKLTIENNKIITQTHFKTVDANSYLEYTSCHHSKWIRNIPFSQLKRIRRNCSDDRTVKTQIGFLKKRFRDKGYPKKLLEDSIKRISKTSQLDSLQPKVVNSASGTKDPGLMRRLSLVTRYSSQHNLIREIFRKNWSILLKDPLLNKSITPTPILTFRRAKTLKNLVAPSCPKLEHVSDMGKKTKGTPGIFKCKSSRCKCCLMITYGISNKESLE
ncbi:uncharacterized protein LOC122923137 [Bufo gargarizans]|uniref:uncharacterized protein LOC122923137 n=1 Tax=Bufo gargarizans TaxID=30331 RepID=UPI001CF49502|nr:uncharacterized protein LOC122923137 [Bufo gargarizans]